MASLRDLTGQVFGRLVVKYRADDYISPGGFRSAQWLCECSCEEHNQIIVRASSLISKDTQSCGCLQKESISQRTKKYNQYEFDGDIIIGHSLNTDDVFYVDFKNFNKIKNIGWDVVFSASGIKRLSGYDTTTKKMILMHQLLGFSNHDHKDQNELNNLESNLRPCSTSQNCMNRKVQKHNTSGYSGVTWDKNKKRWRARININKKQTTIGIFENKEDAIKARLEAEAKYYGEFAPQRHLFEEYGINNKDGDINE